MRIVSVQNRYNLTDRDSHDVLDYCEKEKMGFLPWAPIGGSGRGSLSKSDNSLEAEAKRRNYNPVQLALAWLLQKSPVMLSIPGTANIAHLEENMAAAKIQLAPDECKKIEAAVKSDGAAAGMQWRGHEVSKNLDSTPVAIRRDELAVKLPIVSCLFPRQG